MNRRLSRLFSFAGHADWHIHDCYSHDGKGTPSDFAQAAKACGITSICITNHIEEMNKLTGYYSVEIPRDLEKMKRSLAAIGEARDRYPEIEIKFGVEVENNPRCYPQMEEILGLLDFDFVIGSVHLVDGVPVTASFSKPFLSKQEPESFYRKYYDEMSAFAEWGRFDVLGHLDIIRRFMIELHPGFKPIIHYDILRNVFTLLRNRGQGLEINTGGLFEAPKDIYPTTEILNLALDCGIERFTMGSDAHKPENLARGFGLVKDLLSL